MILVFAFADYYPEGGINDLIYQGDTIDKCRSWLSEPINTYDEYSGYQPTLNRYQFVDSERLIILEQGAILDEYSGDVDTITRNLVKDEK